MTVPYFILNRITLIYVFLILFVPYKISGQDTSHCTRYFLETGGLLSVNSKTPFWLISNSYGRHKPDELNFSLRAGINSTQKVSHNIDFRLGIDVISRFAGQNNTFLHQVYAGSRVHFLTFRAGLWEEHVGNQSELSSGGLLWSGNARPMPRIGIKTDDYIHIPYTKKCISAKAGIDHGWFEKNSYVTGVLLHHKFLYLRYTGIKNIQIEYGLHHFAQWGGKSSDTTYGSLPRNFNSFLRVFSGQGGGSTVPDDEAINAIGNHLGSHQLSLQYTHNTYSVKFYWQTIFEDGSGMRFKNIRDGLWGIGFHFNNFSSVSDILIEFINTTDQSGPKDRHWKDSVMIMGMGNDNYFNNGIYRQGWTYHGMTIGTPVITSPALLSDESGMGIINNKVTAFHIAFSGNLRKTYYKVLYTFSKNYATNLQPFASVKNQHSFFVQSSFDNILPYGVKAIISVGIDKGTLLGSRAGVYFTLKKEGLLKRKGD